METKLYTTEEIINLLKDWRFINPKLISDGHGEFADVYKLSEGNIKELEKLLGGHE